ncbi:MAG: hypothetical protein MPJ50_11875, partial [Pirellulales bacterium]|nr:hypothetical protein [Pirellulales bacterium]
MTDEQGEQLQEPPERIAAANINTAMVVDDAFDLVNAGEIEDELQRFWEPLVREQEDSEPLRNEIDRLTQSAQAAERLSTETRLDDWTDLTDDVLNYLFDELEGYPAIKRRAEQTIFATKLEKLAPLRRLCSHLESLKVKVTTHSSDVDLSQQSACVIFLDYYLGAADDDSAIEQAKTRIRDIYAHVPEGNEKPFVVLMSSKEIGEVQRKFCEEAELLLGLLTFTPKKELEVREVLLFHLATWALHLPQRHAIQSFVESLEGSLKLATQMFRKRIRGLGIEDYANIQWLSLQEEGQPLGDYMLWLYKAMLSHLLHDNSGVLAQQQQLDEMTVDTFLPNHAPPSSDLAELYRFAITVPGVGPAGPHPRS